MHAHTHTHTWTNQTYDCENYDIRLVLTFLKLVNFLSIKRIIKKISSGIWQKILWRRPTNDRSLKSRESFQILSSCIWKWQENKTQIHLVRNRFDPQSTYVYKSRRQTSVKLGDEMTEFEGWYERYSFPKWNNDLLKESWVRKNIGNCPINLSIASH